MSLNIRLRSMKKIISAVLVLGMILALGFCLMANAEIGKVNGTSVDGAVYEISEDGTHVIIIGHSEDFPKLVIPAEIEGLPVTEIAKNAFTNNVDLYSVVIPDSVTVIGEDAFRNCRSLVSITLPSGLKELPMNCFFGCSVLKTLTLPEGLERIGEFCFEGCTKLGAVKIPASVTEIGYDAFVHCENIYLDVSENAYAAGYALEYNVNTDYKGTSQYFWTVIGISVAVALVVFFVIAMLYLRYLKHNPEKNPNIFIFRVLGKVYDGLALCIDKLVRGVTWLISVVLYAVTTAVKYLKLKFGKSKKRPDSDGIDGDSRRD